MQMNRPKEVEVSLEKYERERCTRAKQEPLTIKAGLVLRLFKEANADIGEEKGER